MTASDAYADIGPSAPSKSEIIRRAGKVREFAALAIERANQGEVTKALHWLDRARVDATLGGDDGEDE
jgi:DNA-binding transcriptional regulator YdaS (Cro superfamily)